MTPLTDWIAAAKAGLDQGTLSTRSAELDLRTAVAMLIIALAALDHIAANGRRNTRGLDAQEALDALDALARESAP